MARFNSFSFGKVSGKFGNAVAVVMKDGSNILKTYTTPSNPNTEKQQAQRLKFGLINKEISYMRELFKITFGSTGGVNKVISSAMRDAIVGTFPDFTFDYTQLKLSTGNVELIDYVNATLTDESTVKLTWSTVIFLGISPLDKVNVVLANPAKRKVFLAKAIATRGEGQCEVAFPTEWAEDGIHCWVYLTSEGSKKTSNSQYIPLTTR
jgi:hypothetical protein